MRSIALVLFIVLAGTVQASQLPDFTELVEQNKPAVVNISTTRSVKRSAHRWQRQFDLPEGAEEGPLGDMLRRFFGVPGDPRGEEGWSAPQSHSLGSGFIISDDGYIVTNHHVIHGADEIVVRLSDRREHNAELVGSDPRSDIALLKIDAKALPQVAFGDSSKLRVGEWVLAIGSPFGFDYSVTAGIVSAKRRSLPTDTYVPFIQTDVAINPGNSGGPLFNLTGEVVGVNSQIVSGSGGYMGLSFAVPIDLALDVVDQLKTKGRVSRGWLGVGIQEVTRELAESFKLDVSKGALVSNVVAEGPADKGGIVNGDIILEFDGQSIEQYSDLPPMVGKFEIGDTARVKLLRDGKTLTLKIKIGERPADGDEIAVSKKVPKMPNEDSRLGLLLKSLGKERRQELGIEQGGVEVQALKDGPAAAAGIRRGDVITSINNQHIENVDDFLEKVDKLKPGSSVALLVQRSSGPIFLALRIPKE